MTENEMVEFVMNKRNMIPVAEGVTLFCGIKFECCMWLVEGNDSALLIDTGLGLGNIKEEVEAYTKLPYKVVNTHGHGDHSGGNYLFDDVFMHANALPEAEAALALNRLGLITPEEAERIEALSAGHNTQVHFVREGDVFELGGRTVSVIEIPGHTSGCIALMDSKTGLLFSGDAMVKSMDILMIVPQALTMTRYAESIGKLLSLPGVTGFCSGHDECIMPFSFIENAYACARAVIEGTAQTKEVETGLPDGEPTCMRAVCGDAAILYRAWNIS